MTNRIVLLGALALVMLTTACNNLRSASKGDDANVSAMRRSVVDYAKTLVGSPYKYAGTSPNGFDCSGFTSYVLKEFRVKASNSSSAQAKEGKSVSLEKVKPGDLVFFSDNGRINHVAMVVKREKNGDLTCVHSTTSRGVVVENVSKSTYWKPRIMFARDLIR